MTWLNSIFALVWDIGEFFGDAYEEVKDWIFPFYYLQYPLFSLYMAFVNLRDQVSYFGDWARNLQSVIEVLPTKLIIESWFGNIFEAALSAWEWVTDSPRQIQYIIEDWWSGASMGVVDMVNSILKDAGDITTAWSDFWTVTWPDLVRRFESLLAGWTDFTTGTLPDLVTKGVLQDWGNGVFGTVQSLINSAFMSRSGMWLGWIDIKDRVFEFFSDPWAWLYDRLDDFMERYW